MEKHIATIEVYIGHGTENKSSTEDFGNGKFKVLVDMEDERHQITKRGLKSTPQDAFTSSLVHELGHVVINMTKTRPDSQLKNEERAWQLGEQMGPVNKAVEQAAIQSYIDDNDPFALPERP